MENTKTQETITTEPNQIDTIEKDFASKVSQKQLSEYLLQGLYFIWDAFERANVPFFLVHQTYEDAKANRDLTGDKVEIGVKKTEWVSGGRRIIDAFVTPKAELEFEDGKHQVLYEFKINDEIVPIIVHVYKDSDCIINTDMIRYKYEEFKVPNPYSEFIRLYG